MYVCVYVRRHCDAGCAVQIGGLNAVVLIDCEEFTLQKNLTDRASKVDRVDDSLKAIGRRIAFFKNNVLPILGHFDDLGKLQIVSCVGRCKVSAAAVILYSSAV